MTSAQAVWESWFRAFLTIHQAWPDAVEVACPDGDGGRMRVGYLADPDTRLGTAMAWCDKCRRGIYISRVSVPEGAPMAGFEASAAEQASVVPPDLELFDPDPAPPSTA
ncbi:hypothetical protein [Mangrovihabitans endophyticus]|uniref:hypothetical protein n=1 Tax=Mangrovihabitans endophyticus TaxID=1751298 RepID=UPI001667B966|nr:hypothetical protein [Mangrovihabitans endophyticus]